MEKRSTIILMGAGLAATGLLAPLSGLASGFGVGAQPLSEAEMAASRGGVGVSVVTPAPNTVHYVHNPQLDADVFNYQGQTQTTLYLHHGTSKTGSRTVATPAPGYSGKLQSRFMLNEGVDDLVIKFYDVETGTMKVAKQVASQLLHPDVKLRKVVFHNVETNSNQTNVGRSTLAAAVDGRNFNQALSVSDSVDAILAQCPNNQRVQFTLGGQDSSGSVHEVQTGTNNCANLQLHITVDPRNQDVVLDPTAQACMQELENARVAADPGNDDFHIFIVKDLVGGLGGFLEGDILEGAVIREEEFSQDPWWVATIILHEIGHGFGMSHRAAADADCQSVLPHQRALMCEGSQAGKLLSAAECAAFFNNLNVLEDYN